MSNQTRLIIAVSGPTGAGKSVVALDAAAMLDGAVFIVEFDWYYRDLSHLPLEERHRTNFDRPQALEGPLLAEHLAALRRGERVLAPLYDYVDHVRLPHTHPVEPRQVIIVDGLLALADPAVRGQIDLGVYVDAPEDIRLERRIIRDIAGRGWTEEKVRFDWENVILPAEHAIIRPSARFAHVTIDNSGPLHLAVGELHRAIVSRLK